MDRVITVMTVLYNVPYMRYIVLCEVVMISLGSIQSDNIVLSTAGYHYEIRCLSGTVPLERALCARCGAYCSYIAELAAVLHTYLERLASSHREACHSCILSACSYAVLALDMRHEAVNYIVYEIVVALI